VGVPDRSEAGEFKYPALGLDSSDFGDRRVQILSANGRCVDLIARKLENKNFPTIALSLGDRDGKLGQWFSMNLYPPFEEPEALCSQVDGCYGMTHM